MRHGQATQDDLPTLDIHEYSAVGLVRAPPRRSVRLSKRRDIARSTVAQGQPIQVAAIFGRVCRYEFRPPARVETVVGIERTQARKACIDQPELIIAGPAHFM